MKRGGQFAVLILAATCCWAQAQQRQDAGELPAPADVLPVAQSAVTVRTPATLTGAAQKSPVRTSSTMASAPSPIASDPAVAPAEASESGGPELQQNPLEALRNFEPAPDEEYQLGRGDEITVDFPGRPELQAKLAIGPDGRITLPLAGDLMLAGLTRPQAAKTIQAALAKYYDNLSVQVTVTKYTSNRVLVLGAVTMPGEYDFDGTPTLLEALTRAGLATGPDKIAQIPEECAIYRGSEQVVWVQLKQLIESGNTLADLRLRRDDAIYVPSLSERFVSVLGEVQHPGAIPLTTKSTLAGVVAEAGGFTDVAGSNPHLQIVDPSTGTSRVVSLRQVLDPVKSKEIVLRPGDIVFVPKTGFGKATYVLNRLSPLFSLSTLAYLGAVL